MDLPLHYHWRNLFVRKGTTFLTVAVVGVVVGTFAWLLGFYAALEKSLAMADDDHKVIVIQRGAMSESNSAVALDDYSQLAQLSDVVRDSAGAALISPEVVVQVSLPRINGGGGYANVAVRGVLLDRALDVHSRIRLAEGRQFSTGAPEVIVGRAAARQFGGLQLGNRVKLGFASNREYEVVGYFECGGGPAESEIWGYLPSLQSAYGRQSGYSSAALRIRPELAAAATLEQIRGPAIQLSGQTEREYWQAQAANVRFYQTMCGVLVGLMGLAAVFAIANTMFATVAGRVREIGMLKTIGYGPAAILLGFLIESIFLSLLGGVVGCAACAGYLSVAGRQKDMFGANTFTTLAFELELTPALAGLALVSVALVGAAGALIPAWRAATLDPVASLRQN